MRNQQSIIWDFECMEEVETHHSPYPLLICRVCLLNCVVAHNVEKDVVSSQLAAVFPSSLKVNEQLLVHELERDNRERLRKEGCDKMSYLFELWL